VLCALPRIAELEKVLRKMRRISAAAILAAVLLIPGYADNMPVSGFTSGQFSNPTEESTASGNKWFYDKTSDFVSFDGVTLVTGQTPSPFQFGKITITNYENGPDEEFTANLNLVIHFANPLGQLVHFSDELKITAKSGEGRRRRADGINFDFRNFPDPRSFTVGKEVYTVSFDGFYDGPTNSSSPRSSLFVPNNPGGSASAYLWGTVTSESLHTESLRRPLATVPEPGSIFFLATVAGGIVVSVRRRRRA
jgi:hypothetical protein